MTTDTLENRQCKRSMQIFEVKGTVMQELLNNIDNTKDCKSVNIETMLINIK